MKVAEGVEAIKLTANVMGRESSIYLTLFWDDESVVLVDTGFPGMEQQIQEVAAKAGVPFERLNKVIITHQDIDHIGSLPKLLNQNVEVLAHEGEKPYIQGDKPLIKADIEKLSKMTEALPEPQRTAILSVFTNPPKAKVDRTVSDGEELPDCGGIVVIHTPGHTPGHICLYHKPSKTLVTGDALTANESQLAGPNPSATYDLAEAIKSVKKIALFDIENVICYHGGVFQEDVQKQLQQLTL